MTSVPFPDLPAAAAPRDRLCQCWISTLSSAVQVTDDRGDRLEALIRMGEEILGDLYDAEFAELAAAQEAGPLRMTADWTPEQLTGFSERWRNGERTG